MNEILFFSFAFVVLLLNLIAFRLGKVYMYVLAAMYGLLMNIFVLKQFTLFGLDITGGNILYGAVFLLTDMLSEHYGKKEAYESIKIGFMTIIFYVISTQFLLAFIPNEFDFAQESMITLFGLAPRILIGSLVAYALAQTIDIYLYDKIRLWTKGKYLFLRNNGSTMVSQFIDTIVFTAIGITSFSFLPFEGIIDPAIFWQVVLFAYVIKVFIAIIDTPFLYLSYYLKPSKVDENVQ